MCSAIDITIIDIIKKKTMNGIRKEFEFYNYVFNRLRYIGDLLR